METSCNASYIDSISSEVELIPSPKPSNPKVPMPAHGHTLDFPRKDNVFRTKESLSFEEAYSKVWKERVPQEFENLKEWFAYIGVGFFVGCIAYAMTIEDIIGEWVIHNTVHMIHQAESTEVPDQVETLIKPWLFFAGFAGLFGFISSSMTTYYGPEATGSGVAELVGYLNGVNYPGFISVRSLITKVVGVTFAVVGKLAVGKEGPLAHIGAVAGVLVLYTPFMGFEFLRNDEKKRCFIAAGASAGVSCAFGAPIGGALFAYEMSKPNTFWRFEVIWRVFVSCSVANFTLGFFASL